MVTNFGGMPLTPNVLDSLISLRHTNYWNHNHNCLNPGRRHIEPQRKWLKLSFRTKVSQSLLYLTYENIISPKMSSRGQVLETALIFMGSFSTKLHFTKCIYIKLHKIEVRKSAFARLLLIWVSKKLGPKRFDKTIDQNAFKKYQEKIGVYT